jgi:putative phage-type endonuclease
MRILPVDQNSDEWLQLRKGKVTGSKLKDIVVLRGNTRKMGFYELIAEQLASDEEPEDALERGHRLEGEAVEKFMEVTGKKVETDIGLCVADFNEAVALSPDGLIKNKGKYTEAVEAKCLSASRHIQAVIENEIPKDYHFQVLQYFIVNDDLQKLYFVFYDPRITAKPLHIIEVEREEVAEEVERFKEYQIKTLEEVNTYVEQLAF